MQFNSLHVKKNIKPITMKNVNGLGVVISYKQEEETYQESANIWCKKQNSLIVIYHNGSIGEINTNYEIDTFTPVGDREIYYSCYNPEEKCTQIRSISFEGVDSFITGYSDILFNVDKTEKTHFSKIVDIVTTVDKKCVVLEKYHGSLRYIRDDGNTNIICSGFQKPTKITVLPHINEFIIVDIYGVHIVNMSGKITSIIIHLMPKYNFGNSMCRLKNKILFNNDYCDEITLYNAPEPLLTKSDFHKYKIGIKIEGFHIDNKGNFIVWTEKGIFIQKEKFELSQLEKPIITSSSNLWNPLAIKIIHLSEEAKQNAFVFMLCMEQKWEEYGIPTELGHIILSLSDTWEINNKKLSYL